MTQPTISVDLYDDRRPWSPDVVQVPVADVEERLIEQHGGLTDEEGNPLSPQVWIPRQSGIAEMSKHTKHTKRGKRGKQVLPVCPVCPVCPVWCVWCVYSFLLYRFVAGSTFSGMTRRPRSLSAATRRDAPGSSPGSQARCPLCLRPTPLRQITGRAPAR